MAVLVFCLYEGPVHAKNLLSATTCEKKAEAWRSNGGSYVAELRANNGTVVKRESVKPRAGRMAGFTVVELMIAVAITGLLASIGLAGFDGYKARARYGEVPTHLRSMYHGQALLYQSSELRRLPALVPGTSVGRSGFDGKNYAVCYKPTFLARPKTGPSMGVAPQYRDGCSELGFTSDAPTWFVWSGWSSNNAEAHGWAYVNTAVEDLNGDRKINMAAELIVPDGEGGLRRRAYRTFSGLDNHTGAVATRVREMWTLKEGGS